MEVKMFKKIALVLILFLVMSGYADAQHVELSGSRWVDTETINDSGDAATIAVSTSVIYPEASGAGSLILGFSVMPKVPTTQTSGSFHTEAFATLYDTTDDNLDLDTNEIINEIEGPNGAGDSEWFPYPYRLKNQVISRQGAWTEVVIYFVQ